MSSNIKFYGDMAEEKRTSESIQAREIAQEIIKFGVSQHQLTKIIYLLAIELEDRALLETLSDILRPLLFKDNEKNNNNSIIVE
jgi:hypothetical protein